MVCRHQGSFTRRLCNSTIGPVAGLPCIARTGCGPEIRVPQLLNPRRNRLLRFRSTCLVGCAGGMIEVLNDSDEDYQNQIARNRAIFALKAIGPAAAVAIPALVELLRSVRTRQQ